MSGLGVHGGSAAGGSGLTDAELRATDVDVIVTNIPHVIVDSLPADESGLTNAELRATPVPVSGPLTNAELRASAVDVTASTPLNVGLTNINGATIDIGQTVMDDSLPVTIANNQSALPVTIAATVATKEVRASTPAQSTVSVLTSNTSILAANANRLGATLYNESGAIAYVKLGVTASLTSYSIQIAIGGYYEVPFGYTGAIDGITVAITAVLRVTELTV